MNRAADELVPLSGFSFPLHASPGAEEAGLEVGRRCEAALAFLTELFDFRPRVVAMVLAPEHWQRHGTFPVYGMPHFMGQDTLVVASQDNDVWRGMEPPMEALSSSVLSAGQRVYGLPDGSLAYGPFFDLVAVHELGHIFHLQAGVEFQRLWLREFFCDLCMHAYVALREPESLSAVETFPAMIVAGGEDHLQHRSLADFERLYVGVGIREYGWYQSQFLFAAKRVFEVQGVDVLRRLWRAFLGGQQQLDDNGLADLLHAEVDPEVARILTDWPPGRGPTPASRPDATPRP